VEGDEVEGVVINEVMKDVNLNKGKDVKKPSLKNIGLWIKSTQC